MNVDEIRNQLKRLGPHVVRASDGHEYRVPHPEFVMVGRRNVVFEWEDGLIEVVDPLHVVAIRKAPATKGKNGSSGKAN